jgi:hypothetical protein
VLCAGRHPCLKSTVTSAIQAKVASVQRIVACSSSGKTGSINPGIFKIMYKVEVDGPTFLKLNRYAETQGAYAGMDAHRVAAAIRLSNLKD